MLSSPSAKAGEPSNVYTGAIVVEKLDDDLLCSQQSESTSPDGTYSNLHRVTADGAVTDSVLVPGLAWQTWYIPELRRIIVLADHQVRVRSHPTAPCWPPAPIMGRSSCARSRMAGYTMPGQPISAWSAG